MVLYLFGCYFFVCILLCWVFIVLVLYRISFWIELMMGVVVVGMVGGNEGFYDRVLGCGLGFSNFQIVLRDLERGYFRFWILCLVVKYIVWVLKMQIIGYSLGVFGFLNFIFKVSFVLRMLGVELEDVLQRGCVEVFGICLLLREEVDDVIFGVGSRKSGWRKSFLVRLVCCFSWFFFLEKGDDLGWDYFF